MPNVYKALDAGRVPDLIGINDAPGKKIMRQVSVINPTFAELFREFCAYFHQPGHWTWDGGAGTPADDEVLDGDKQRGQCVALARALRMLATMPKPHGLGLSKAVVGDPAVPGGGLYKGLNNDGFISAHPPAGVLGLLGNVYDTAHANLANCGRAFYSWDDHKVVPYNGVYYDPSYRTTWLNLPQMATYHSVVGAAYRRNNLPNLPATEVHDFVGYVDNAANNVYFRHLTLAEVNTLGVKYGSLQGPYLVLPGNAV